MPKKIERGFVKLKAAAGAAAIFVVGACNQIIDANWSIYVEAKNDSTQGSGGAGGNNAGGNDAGGSGGMADGCAGAGSTPTPPSCPGGAPTCGLMAPQVSCCDSPFVPCSEDKTCGPVGAFRLDRFEVTVSRFKEFIATGAGVQTNPPAAWDSAWKTKLALNKAALEAALANCGGLGTQFSTFSSANNDLLPINCVTWFEALAFCEADGATLPTPAEFMFAATANEAARKFPWGLNPVPDPEHAICCHPGGTAADIAAVGNAIKGYSKFGQFDLLGNVAEWTLIPAAACSLPPTPLFGDQTTFGGSFTMAQGVMMTPAFGTQTAITRSPETGFRCVRKP